MMVNSVKRFLIILTAIVMVAAEPLLMAGVSGMNGARAGMSDSVAYADVGSVADGQDVAYDKNGGVLASLGFDTSKLPADYDPDATTNPYGSDVTTLNEVEEIVRFDAAGADEAVPDKTNSLLYGHNKNLDGKYDTFARDPIQNHMEFLDKPAFMAAVKCDINGNGRDSALAIVYTYYNYADLEAGTLTDDDRKILMRIYDPKTGIASDPFEIAKLEYDAFKFSYMVQSQMQITAGDYDKDSVDEIAVYAPAGNESRRSKIMVFDLTEGKDCENPYSKASWRESWNYVLPVVKENVISIDYVNNNPQYVRNIYNNIDLASGDADNDGICDMIISYGASDTNYGKFFSTLLGDSGKIIRSLPSKSVLLYGSDRGQMLKDQQEISYGGSDLIRVSFSFGDIDGDGNEDMFIGGQLQGEQSENISRVIGRYVYDEQDKQMELEGLSDLKIVDGQWDKDDDNNTTFISSNGWDGYYFSSPLMKANLTIGNIMGDQSSTKIYLDSVLISYDGGNYDIVDELEDTSTEKSGSKDVNKGSQVLADFTFDISGTSLRCPYYEYGADGGNFAGSANDYMIIHRKAVQLLKDIPSYDEAAILKLEDKQKNPALIKIQNRSGNHLNAFRAPYYYMTTADTDLDSMIARYSGEHNITYSSPKVLAVLASAPYFQDVANFDGGDMLNWCSTSYGKSSGNMEGYHYTYSSNVGAFVNGEVGFERLHAITDTSMGQARSSTWGHEDTREFEISFDTAGGEDAVVMYSIPTENYMYDLECISVDDDGNIKVCKQKLVLTDTHNPVTQTLTLDDYMEIQRQPVYSVVLPDVTKYLTSTPGDPSTYPKSENDLSAEAKLALSRSETEVGDEFAGVAYGSGTITQSITHSHSETGEGDDVDKGTFFNLDLGIGSELGTLFYVSAGIGVKMEFEWTEGATSAELSGVDFSGTVANMPKAAKGYGYDYDWKLFKYVVKDKLYKFPIISYIVNDVTAPPRLPDNIEQDFDNTSDSQIALTWAYNYGDPQKFDIYRFEDFPQGGGDKLVGTVDGSDFRIMKDEDGNTLRDANGHVIRQYSFTDTGLTADTKYSYRMKVARVKMPNMSIFSPVIEARTNVSTMPKVSLSTDSLTIYRDSTYDIKASLDNSDGSYQNDVNYQWQKYNEKTRKWADLDGCDKQILRFYNCKKENEGKYRCRINCIRKRESSPQYISVFTEACTVKFSLRSVEFGQIKVFDGDGISDTNTGLSVTVANANKTSTIKPTGTIDFTITGPNGSFTVFSDIDEETGTASIPSIEDLIGTKGANAFVPGGYLIKASYRGTEIFYPAEDPEDYHYLRNIDDCIFLSTQSQYYFGDDVMETAGLFDYKKNVGGNVLRTDLTDELSVIKFYELGDDGKKTGDAVETCTLSDTSGKACVPLDSRLSEGAYVEAYVKGSDDPVAGSWIETMKIQVELAVNEKMCGTGDMLDPVTYKDVALSNGVDPEKANIVVGDKKKPLSDYMVFSYYEQNGDYMFDSDELKDDPDLAKDLIPASYIVDIALREQDEAPFYTASFQSARFMVVGSYYKVSARAKDPSSGSVQMIAPDDYTDFDDKGYAGGTKLTLKAVPNTGYEIKHWIVNECGEKEYTLPGDAKIDYSVRSGNTTGNGDVLIQAVMKPKDNRLTYGTVGNGEITVSPEVNSGGTVLADTKLNFTAKAGEGWKFEEWRFTNYSGDNIVSGGVMNEDGTNSKEFTMPDGSAEVYALFAKDTVNVLVPSNLEVLFLNDGSDPDHDNGELVLTEKGRDVPKGAVVTVRTKAGYVLAPGASWAASVNKGSGIEDLPVTEAMSEGREACTFTLPEDAESCTVSADTVAGHYSVTAAADDSQFRISIDGSEMTDSTVDGISTGSQVDIKALPERGKVVTAWVINGEKKDLTDTTYSCNIKENMNVTVITGPDEKTQLSMKTEGGGKAKYVITDKNGDTHDGTFEGTEVKADVYKGESVFFTVADDEKEHTLTSLFMDGVYQNLDQGTFTIESVENGADILVRFGQNTYYDAKFNTNLRGSTSMVLDEDAAEIKNEESLKIPKGGDLEFSVVVPNGGKCFVTRDLADITSVSSKKYDDKRTRYYFKVEALAADTVIYVSDHETVYIETSEDLANYFNELKDSSDPSHVDDAHLENQPDAVLTKDIDMTGVNDVTPPYQMAAVFDGDGHTITGLTMGYPGGIYEWYGMFGSLQQDAAVKNVIFYQTKVKALSTEQFSAMLTYENHGTISRVVIMNSEFDLTHTGTALPAAVLAYDNHGVIENCKISGFTLKNDNETQYAGSAGVVFNQQDGVDGDGSLTGCYFEDFKVQGSDSQSPVPATESIVCYDNTNRHKGVFKGNYFKAAYGVNDSHGRSVYSITEKPNDQSAAEAEVETIDFSRKLVHAINKDTSGNAWGASGFDGSNEIRPIIGKSWFLPTIKVDFVAGRTVTQYIFAGDITLPGENVFGNDAPVAWEIGNVAFAPGTTYTVNDDVTINGIMDFKGYQASLTESTNLGDTHTVYYKKLDDALRAAAGKDATSKLDLKIIGDAETAQSSIIIDNRTTFTVASGASLKIGKNTQINNNGSIIVEQGAKVDKYGSMLNEGTIVIPKNTFNNYGSALSGSGMITNRENINCVPHLFGGWKFSDKPNDQGQWMKTSTCEVCGKEVSEEVEPNPPAVKVASIDILTPADKTLYEAGEKFTSDGLKVYAVLTDGTKASVTQYSLLLKTGDDENEIKDGDDLDTPGKAEIVVKYDHFTTSYEIDVLNTAELLTLTGPDGNEISKAEIEEETILKIKASLKEKLPYKTDFKWELSGDNAVSLSAKTGSENDVTAFTTGSSVITVTVVDENGNPVDAVKPKTVDVTVVSHIKGLYIAEKDISVDKGEKHKVVLVKTPEDATDEIKWTSSNENVAVVDESGEITGKSGGKALITAAAANGLSDTCTVFVHEKATDFTIEPDKLELITGRYATLSAKVQNPFVNSDVVWTVEGGACGFFVRNKETGQMEILDTVTTALSADGSGTSDAYVIVTGVDDGTAVVKAEMPAEGGGTIVKECEVTVTPSADYVSITHNGAAVSGQTMNLAIEGKFIQLGAESSKENDTLTWSTVDDDENPVLKVDNTGRVALLRKGVAVVSLKSDITGAEDSFMIRVISEPTGLVLSEDEITIKKGMTHTLIAMLLPDDSEGNVIWKSSDESVAVVSDHGKIEAVGEGTAIITAVPDAYGAESAECKVTVFEDPVTIELSDTQVAIKKGKTFKLDAKVIPSDETGKIEWSSSDPNVAEVSEDGTVKGIGVGEADITAVFSKKGSVPSKCRVTVHNPKLTVKLNKATFIYNGKKQVPKLTVTSGDIMLGKDLTKSSADVIVMYLDANSKMPGKYKAAAMAREWFYGSGEAEYTIKVKPTSLKKLKKGKKSFTVKWKKVGKKYITGYQVRWSRKKSMKGSKSKLVKKWSKTKLKVKKLKGGKKYYVQVRTYVKKNGITYYSDWSKAKKVKTKR